MERFEEKSPNHVASGRNHTRRGNQIAQATTATKECRLVVMFSREQHVSSSSCAFPPDRFPILFCFWKIRELEFIITRNYNETGRRLTWSGFYFFFPD